MVFEEKHHMLWAYDAHEAYEAEFSGGRGELLPPSPEEGGMGGSPVKAFGLAVDWI